MTEKLIFAQTFEGLLRSVQDRLTPQVVEGLKAMGLDTTAPLLPTYSHTVFIDVVTYLAGQLHPGVDRDAATTLVGRDFMDAYGETMVGRAMIAMIRLIGPRRALERLTREFRTGNNYSETRLTPRGEREYELWVNEVRLPGWYLGILSRGLELAGAKGVKVGLISRQGTDGTFHVSWAS